MKSLVRSLYIFAVITSFTFFVTSCSSISSVEYKKFQQPATDILITNTNVLSEDGRAMLPNQNVLIQNGLITAITVNAISSESALVIDGQEKYLIPGLIDSHVHLQDSENDLLVYLAHGITYVREMSGNDQHHKWREEINEGRVAPSIEVSSEKISSKSGLWGLINEFFWTRINISSEQDAMALAESLKDDNYANAKISSDINKEMYFAITKAAKKTSLSVTGHIPGTVSFEEFLESGQGEIAHIEELVKMMNREFGYFTTANGDDFLKFIEERSREVAGKLKERNISVSSSFWYMQSIPEQVSNLPDLIEELDLSFTNPERVTEWMPEKNDFALNHTHLIEWWSIFAKANEVVLRELIKNETVILVGTDAMTSLVIPGISLHQELAALVNAGMSNTQAINNATRIPAEWMGVKVGKLSKGYAADILILNNNPLEDIDATRDIQAVIKGGRLYKKELLESMLDSIRRTYSHR
ncbi:amidohydrolase family protein [Aliikangiella sp. G2MR2-5]|uniref:amidohydrolase family protein n=1 Tax=Aliikangiella sp. G2MR2-5 TaxID=2788943 RepID=UPI0018A9E83E|nr:amidohydrolase family protein [Aliikangiella sp. G2MR2-5]